MKRFIVPTLISCLMYSSDSPRRALDLGFLIAIAMVIIFWGKREDGYFSVSLATLAGVIMVRSLVYCQGDAVFLGLFSLSFFLVIYSIFIAKKNKQGRVITIVAVITAVVIITIPLFFK